MAHHAETDLYHPIKTYWESRGYAVKSEIAAADVVAIDGQGDPVVIELKLGFSLTLLHQATARQSMTSQVYVAVPKWRGRVGWRAFKANLALCRRLELGVLVVDLSDGSVKEYAAPKPFQRRKNTKRTKRLHSEFDRRLGDPNQGGARAGHVITSHRQRSEICAKFLAEHGPSRGADVASKTDITEATRLMAANLYGWFDRVERGTYTLSKAGQAAIART